MPDDSPFMRLRVHEVQARFLELLQRIACETGRVEIIGQDSQCDCVLISKQELESLERALEMLSDSEQVRVLTERISHYAAMDTGPGARALTS